MVGKKNQPQKKKENLGRKLSGSLTVSLFMNPQIAAATSQAKRITKKKKNYRKKSKKNPKKHDYSLRL